MIVIFALRFCESLCAVLCAAGSGVKDGSWATCVCARFWFKMSEWIKEIVNKERGFMAGTRITLRPMNDDEHQLLLMVPIW